MCGCSQKVGSVKYSGLKQQPSVVPPEPNTVPVSRPSNVRYAGVVLPPNNNNNGNQNGNEEDENP